MCRDSSDNNVPETSKYSNHNTINVDSTNFSIDYGIIVNFNDELYKIYQINC